MSNEPARPKIDTTALFQHFPHLRCIEENWGTAACRNQLMALMNDTRGGERKGFPPEHAHTLFRLMLEHDADFPQFEDSTNPAVWTDASHDREYWKP